MPEFAPKRVFFEPEALEYPLGKELHAHFEAEHVPIYRTTSHNRVTGIPGSTPAESYREAKDTLVVGVRRSKDFSPCKPSAHYQLPLVTSCPGKCEYCYLATTLGKKPYVRVYVNIDAILARAREYIRERQPETTLFEGAATSDPLAVEPLTHSLAKTIVFFAGQEFGRFRFVTKFANVETLLDVKHEQHTRVRFSVNLPRIISRFEHGVPDLSHRLAALRQVSLAGYPTGLMIGPIFLEPDWQQDYLALLEAIRESVPEKQAPDFELITHRFTKRAKTTILDIYPNTDLPMDENERRFKFGQFGYGKYLYPKETMQEAEHFFREHIGRLFPGARIEYFV